jgi:F0F1-type ATP synthase membrane subunit c/vacuolar-type H+-ATPase subunit K
VISLLVYLFVALSIRDSNSTNPPDSLLPIVFAVLSVATLVGGIFIRRIRLARKKDSLEAMLRNYRTTLTVSLALSEAVGLYGFILYFIGSEMWVLVVFIGMALAAMVRVRPTMQDLTEYLASQLRQDEG